ncbi:hypothetical protein QBZ16_002744 [Prototheca wickerhamii]|uniref:t-SNARE coiled-coil homology domain-containing protein n=1 Tax=Prototheca wickerhamii TaxID=3111 RepID=A0AAD9IIC3_PROWI|nr:hypothetical protein QBZ16_002744 [Prototheca wickerhamii]
MQDPFFIVQKEVNDTVGSTEFAAREKYSEVLDTSNAWLSPAQLQGVQSRLNQLRSLPPTHGNRKALQTELEDDCRSVEYMLNEIERSLDAAEADPARFKLSQADLAERRKWALASQRQTSSLQTSIASARAASEAGPKLTASSKLAAAVHDENDRFIHSESQRQQQLLRQQDDDLDMLGDHVVRIGELGREMGQELHLQGQLLDEFDEELDGTTTRLAAAQKKVQAVLDRAGSRGQLAIIGVLIVLLVLLVILAIS